MMTSATELIGKTIKKAEIKKINKECDDEPFLDLEMTDGTMYRIEANYHEGSTGKSENEYPRYITVGKMPHVGRQTSVDMHDEPTVCECMIQGIICKYANDWPFCSGTKHGCPHEIDDKDGG